MVQARKRIAFTLFTAVLMSMLSACDDTELSGSYSVNPNPQTLTFAKSGDHTLTGMEEIFSLYEQQTGNKVVIETIANGNEYEKVIKAKVASKEVPDLIFYYPGSAQYETLGYDQLMDLSEEPYVNQMTSTSRQFQTVNDRIYGVPWGSFSSMGIIYNKPLFKKLGLKPPVDYADFLRICEVIKAAGIIPIFEAGKDAWPTQVFSLASWGTFIDPTLGQEGIRKLNTNQIRLTSLSMLKNVFERQLELKRNGYLNADFIESTYETQQEVIATGKAAMIVQGEWILPEIKEIFGDKAVNELGMFPIPSDEDEGVAALYAPAQILIPVHGKNPEIAKELARFITETASLNVWYKHNPGIPVYKNARSKLTTAQVDINKFARIGQSQINIQIRLTAQFLDYDKITQTMLVDEQVDKAIATMDENYRKDGENKKLKGF